MSSVHSSTVYFISASSTLALTMGPSHGAHQGVATPITGGVPARLFVITLRLHPSWRRPSSSTSLAVLLFTEPLSAFLVSSLQVHAPEARSPSCSRRCRPDLSCIPGALDGTGLHLDGWVNAATGLRHIFGSVALALVAEARQHAPMTAAWAAFQLWSSPLCVVLADDLLFPAIPVDDQLGLRRHPT